MYTSLPVLFMYCITQHWVRFLSAPSVVLQILTCLKTGLQKALCLLQLVASRSGIHHQLQKNDLSMTRGAATTMTDMVVILLPISCHMCCISLSRYCHATGSFSPCINRHNANTHQHENLSFEEYLSVSWRDIEIWCNNLRSLISLQAICLPTREHVWNIHNFFGQRHCWSKYLSFKKINN